MSIEISPLCGSLSLCCSLFWVVICCSSFLFGVVIVTRLLLLFGVVICYKCMPHSHAAFMWTMRSKNEKKGLSGLSLFHSLKFGSYYKIRPIYFTQVHFPFSAAYIQTMQSKDERKGLADLSLFHLLKFGSYYKMRPIYLRFTRPIYFTLYGRFTCPNIMRVCYVLSQTQGLKKHLFYGETDY